MHKIATFTLLAASSFGIVSASAQPAVSEATLAALDPTRIARSMCGGAGARTDSLADRLQLAQDHSVAVGLEMASMPLVDHIPRSSLPASGLSGEARQYFDQGVAFTFGFNHVAAIRSFRQAQRLAPDCAMCWWGEAMANGPNINAAMDSEQNRAALAALERAEALSGDISAQERALIAAQARRYAPETEGDRSELDAAYADAMLALARQSPENDDLAVLAAEAAMNTSPWNYWDEQGAPRPRIGEAVALVEKVMARNGSHPQASHLYIHLMESPRPNLAEAAADRLSQSGPPALGHLVHMPAHIYHRLGRYADSVRANIAAARADEVYLASIGDDGAYRFGYYPHNVHFLLTSAQMLGDMSTVAHESERLTRILDVDTAKALPWVQAIHAAPYFAAAQYQSPAAILSLTGAPSELPYVEGIRHYARAIAHAHDGNKAAFERELASLDALSSQPEIAAMASVGLPAQDLLQLASLMARGRAAHLSENYQSAIVFYTSATEIEARLPYNEPAFWYQPVAQSLGASLLEAGRLQEARTAFRRALIQAPNSGWALYGLAATERKAGNALEAKAAEVALERNWMGERRWLRMNRL